jgi:hypothetical protein
VIEIALGLTIGVLLIIALVRGNTGLGDAISLVAMGLIITATTGLVGGLIAFCVGLAIPSESGTCTLSYTQQLQSLSTGQSVSGSFWLGSGYVNGSLRYFYFYRDGSGGYRGGSMPASDVEVFTDERERPHIAFYDWHLPVAWRLIALPSQTCFASIHIPPGSVDNNYSVKP